MRVAKLITLPIKKVKMLTALARHVPKSMIFRPTHIPLIAKLEINQSNELLTELYERILAPYVESFASAVEKGAVAKTAFEDLLC
jgi:hypothetical protein